MRSVILCVAMVVLVFSMYRRDWTHADAMAGHGLYDSAERGFPAIDVGLRDYHVHDYMNRYEELDDLFLSDGRRIEAAGKRAYQFGWAAVVACSIACGLLLRRRPPVLARVALTVPLLASMWTTLAYTGWLSEKLHTFTIGACAYLMPLALAGAAAAVVWPFSKGAVAPLPRAQVV